jgi:hypothetical protein
MSLIDHAEQALGVLSLLFIAGSGALSLHAIISTAAPQWRRMLHIGLGRHLSPAPRAQRLAQPRKAAA